MIDWPYAALHDADGALLLPLTVDGPEFDPFTVDRIDLGTLDVREDVDDSPNGDGTDDYTQFAGGAAVSISMAAHGNDDHPAGWWLDELAGLCQPSTRVYLHVQRVDWDQPRRILLRGAAAPRDISELQPDDVQFQWKAPQGWLETLTAREEPIYPIGAVTEGIAEPWSDPASTTPSYGGEVTPFVVGGQKRTDWEADIYDITGPVLTNQQGLSVAFEDTLVIPSGHFVRLISNGPDGPQALLDGDPDQSVEIHTDFALSTWWPLAKGPNRISLTSTVLGSSCHALLRWRDRW